MNHPAHSPDQIANARRLRREATSAERRFWSLVRKHRLNGVKFRRQHPHRQLILDFYAAQAAVAVEFDGIFHDDACRRDAARDAKLSLDGVLTLRFENEELFFNPELVLEKVWSALEFGCGWCEPPPGAFAPPSPLGEGSASSSSSPDLTLPF